MVTFAIFAFVQSVHARIRINIRIFCCCCWCLSFWNSRIKLIEYLTMVFSEMRSQVQLNNFWSTLQWNFVNTCAYLEYIRGYAERENEQEGRKINLERKLRSNNSKFNAFCARDRALKFSCIIMRFLCLIFSHSI